jgi:hypothetical protein
MIGPIHFRAKPFIACDKGLRAPVFRLPLPFNEQESLKARLSAAACQAFAAIRAGAIAYCRRNSPAFAAMSERSFATRFIPCTKEKKSRTSSSP